MPTPLLLLVTLAATGDLSPPEPEALPIVGGSAVGRCGLPTVVAINGGSCTGSLVHPRVVSTAQHCGDVRTVEFGEGGAAGFAWQAGVIGCVSDGSEDATLCLLDVEVPLPTAPVVYGCEIDELLRPDAQGNLAPVVIAGFGQTGFGQPSGEKMWATQVVTDVQSQRVIVGHPGQGPSPCPGDSGGPAYVQAPDGSWRTVGTVFRGTTGAPCNSAADLQRVDRVVPFFEARSGLDITPCFDAQSGAWEPGPDCGGFSTAGPAAPSGARWDDWCAPQAAAGPAFSCGAPFDGADTGEPLPAAQSCAGSCGGQTASGCWCDAQCVQAGDCCSDVVQACDIPADGAYGGSERPAEDDRGEGADRSGAVGCRVASQPPISVAAIVLLLLGATRRRRR